jgi:hypothetical protein
MLQFKKVALWDFIFNAGGTSGRTAHLYLCFGSFRRPPRAYRSGASTYALTQHMNYIGNTPSLLTRELADLAPELLKSSRRSHNFEFRGSKMHQKQLNRGVLGTACVPRGKCIIAAEHHADLRFLCVKMECVVFFGVGRRNTLHPQRRQPDKRSAAPSESTLHHTHTHKYILS